MIVVKPVGGLASQLHKYAIGKALADSYGVDLKLDLSWFKSIPDRDTPWEFKLQKFDIPIDIATTEDIASLKPNRLKIKSSYLLNKFFGLDMKFSTYSNDSFLEYDIFRALPADVYLEGEFVGYKYFEELKSDLQALTNYHHGSSVIMDSHVLKIKENNRPTVSIHFRRGDFISNQAAAKFHNVCTDEYYLKALSVMKKMIGDFDLVVFSDEIEWVQANFSFKNFNNVSYVKGLEDYQEFQLMGLCDHNIISNSGFSWFASWLNKNNNIVIAPLNWVYDYQINQRIIEGIADYNLIFLKNG